MNVLFLDYDGVVNTPMWDAEGTRCVFNVPLDNKVNNFQAVQWVSEFCQKYNYSIVVTSSWRFDKNWKDCLINGGLRKDVKIVGRTKQLYDKYRGDEIQQYLDEHPDVESFIILDDDSDMCHLTGHLVQCNPYTGFLMPEFEKAKDLDMKFTTKV